LRATTGGRCSECGLAFDPADLARSNFPWLYRGQRGGFRAFLATVWLVTRDSKRIRHETAKSQSVPDALRFRRWVMTLVAATFAGVATLVLATQGVTSLVVDKPSTYTRMTGSNGVAASADLLVPWSAGMIFWAGPILYAAGLGIWFVRAPMLVLRPSSAPSDGQADIVRAIGCYVTAPFVWVVPWAVGGATVVATDQLKEVIGKTLVSVGVVVGACLALTMYLAVIGTIFHTGQWRARVTRRGWGTGFLAMGEVLLRWAVGAAVCFGLLPWCVGFVRIVVDSFRF
jgi:hypothetical protein